MSIRNWWPILAAGAMASLYVGSKAIPPAEGLLHLRAAGAIPVVAGGRIKPLDTLARSTLIIISGRQTYVDPDGVQQPAIRWLFDALAEGDAPNWPVRELESFPNRERPGPQAAEPACPSGFLSLLTGRDRKALRRA